jgi:hypothetical protein
MNDLVLNEGWDLALVSPEDIQRGDRYSLQAQQFRPLGSPHQRLLLDFIQAQTSAETLLNSNTILGNTEFAS